MTCISLFSVIRPLGQHDQPIDLIEPNSAYCLAKVETKVECWVRKTSRSTGTLSHQDPFLMRHGSQPTSNRPPHLVASYDTQGVLMTYSTLTSPRGEYRWMWRLTTNQIPVLLHNLAWNFMWVLVSDPKLEVLHDTFYRSQNTATRQKKRNYSKFKKDFISPRGRQNWYYDLYDKFKLESYFFIDYKSNLKSLVY